MQRGPETHLTPDVVRGIFHRNNLRCTHQRELVYVGLASTRCHPTAEELYQSLHAQDPNISLATVYNTLDALSEVGLVRKVPTPAGPCRYDAETTPHVHISLPDGRLVDAPEEVSARVLAALPQDVLDELAAAHGVTITCVQLHASPMPR